MTQIDISRFEHAKDRRVQRTIKAIHAAFIELAAEQNINKITVAAVSERANINRKTFYLHYDSIEDLIEEVLYDEVLMSTSRVSEKCFDGQGNIDVNELFITLGVEMMRSFNDHAEIYKHVNSKWLIDHVEPMLTEAIIQNDSLKLADILGPYLKYCVTFYCAGLMTVYRRWLDDESELPMEKLSEYLSLAVKGGVFALVESAGSAGA